MQSKIPVGILGATGSVGKKFAELLNNHPWFELTAVTASDRSVGSDYLHLKLRPSVPDLPCKLVFSALDADCAENIEQSFAKAGYTVISNTRTHRLYPEVPLIVPEINAKQLNLLSSQSFGPGKIITCPNCSTVGLALALKPLSDLFELEAVHVVTLQALSGAGKNPPDVKDNVIPYIPLEEEKIERETHKILEKKFKISATCTRVPVSDGHLACVSVKLKRPATSEQIIHAWNTFPSLSLPSSPKQPIVYYPENDSPQPKTHRNLERGMAVSIGRLRECPILDYKFVLLSHNTIRGAAGGALLTAELFFKQYQELWQCRQRECQSAFQE